MNSTGIVFAIVATLSWSICIFPFTIAARKLGVNTLNHFRLIIASIVIGSVAALLNWQYFTGIFSTDYINPWLWLGLSGIIGLTFGDYFAFIMYRILGARLGSVLTTFAPAAALILGSLIINERISVIGISGIVVTIAGVNILIFGKAEREKIPDHGHGSISKGIVAGILAALCQGAGLVLAKKGMMSANNHQMIPAIDATFMRLSIACISLFSFTLVSGKIKEVLLPVKINQQNGLKYAIAGTIFGPVLAVSFSLLTVSLLDPSVAQTIFSLVPAVAFILAALFYKEKLTIKSITGLMIALTGVIILIWRTEIKNFL